MRKALIGALVSLARRDDRVVLMTGDLGFTVVEPFAEEFPGRFFNVGVAEQNMVGMATGLAEAGLIPFVYSIVTFASLRPYEFVRNGPIAHQLPVRILGIGGGFDYGTAGLTHYGLEDLAVMRTQPGITVLAPADFAQAVSAIEQTWEMERPIYVRVGKEESSTLPGLDGRFRLGRAERVREGSDILLIAIGGIASSTLAAANLLAEQGVEAEVVIVSSFNPSPVEDLAEAMGRHAVAMTVEAHYVNGGLGSLAAEVIAENGIGCRLARCGVRTTPTGKVGSTAYMDSRHGLDPASLAASARAALEVGSLIR